MNTWSDVLEELRRQHNDDTEYEWIVPIQLLNTTFDWRSVQSDYEKLSTIAGYCASQLVVAWSGNYIYLVLNDDEAPYMAAVRRNPPQ
jgi:hypothetical protein